jgi:uncharacterized SAM-binding protein YcdF (DUF218 family)
MSWLSYSSLVPPNLFVLLTVLGVLLAWRRARLGLLVATVGAIPLYLASTPIVADSLIRAVEALAGIVPGAPAALRPGAIIVLSADFRHGDGPGAPDTVGRLTLERLAEAASEERRTGLPILVSGGRLKNADDSLASMMSTVLQDDFHIAVRWREDRSDNTYENAAFSAELLRRAGVPSALLVTHPWHMARALWSFHAVGYPVVPAVLPEGEAISLSASSFFPQVTALLGSYYALHELIGFGWYLCRYGVW